MGFSAVSFSSRLQCGYHEGVEPRHKSEVNRVGSTTGALLRGLVGDCGKEFVYSVIFRRQICKCASRAIPELPFLRPPIFRVANGPAVDRKAGL